MKALAFAAIVAALILGSGCGGATPQRPAPGPRPHVITFTEASCRPTSMGAAERCKPDFRAFAPSSAPFGVKGIDLSNNDPSFGRWDVIHRFASFAYFKVSEGIGFVDSTAARMAREARAHGLLVGGYDFQHVCGANAAGEAAVFVRAARAAHLLAGPGVLPPTADFELSFGSCNRAGWLRAWTRAVRRLTHVVVYSDPGFYVPSVGCFHDADVGWVADLGAFQPLCGLPTSLHQWSFTYWDGVASVDGDVFRGTPAQLRTLAAVKPSKRQVLWVDYKRRGLLLADLHRHGCFHIHGKHAYRLCPRWGREWRETEAAIRRLHAEGVF